MLQKDNGKRLIHWDVAVRRHNIQDGQNPPRKRQKQTNKQLGYWAQGPHSGSMKPTQTAQRQPISRAAGTHEGGAGAGAVFRDVSLVCYRWLVSPWKPAVPYPVHGRVLVEIQRPGSLHRKAVIQLNTKRNQENQPRVGKLLFFICRFVTFCFCFSVAATYRNDRHSGGGVVDLGAGVEVFLDLPCYWQLMIVLAHAFVLHRVEKTTWEL